MRRLDVQALLHDPHPVYRSLRQGGGVQRVELPGGLRLWAVTGYQEVVQMLRADGFTRDWRMAPGPGFDYRRSRHPEDYFAACARQLFSSDGSHHAMLDQLSRPFFARPALDRLRPRVDEVVDQVIGQLAGQTDADLVAQFAVPIPLAIVGQILGVNEGLYPAFAQHLSIVSGWLDPATARWRRASRELHRLALRAMSDRWNSPGDDLISLMIRAHQRHGLISRAEVASAIPILMGTGYETTASLLANATLEMINDPSLACRLGGDKHEVDAVVEELLRHNPPSPFGQVRFALRDVRLGPADIRAGDLVYPIVAAANRDPSVYSAPDRLCPGREEAAHLAFGRGRRRCVGAELARLIAKTALSALARRFPNMTLAAPASELSWSGILHLRILHRLPVFLRPGKQGRPGR